jgi:biotin carboxyl carrier protein
MREVKLHDARMSSDRSRTEIMKLNASISGQPHELDLQFNPPRLTARVDGRLLQVEARDLGNGEYLLLHEGRVYQCRVETAGSDDQLHVHVGHESYQIAIADPKRLSRLGSSSVDSGASARIVAPMSGKVISVLVEAGARVEQGDGLMVVEAMKMQNEMKAPRAGTVLEVRAVPGAAVNAGDVLAILE